MIEYLPYVYMAYTIINYSKAIYTTGKDILDIYSWIKPNVKKDENRYVDWILVSDENILK